MGFAFSGRARPSYPRLERTLRHAPPRPDRRRPGGGRPAGRVVRRGLARRGGRPAAHARRGARQVHRVRARRPARSPTSPPTGPSRPTEFNQVTAENAMKWDATEPSRRPVHFAGADQIVAFAHAERPAGARPHAGLAQPDAGLGAGPGRRRPCAPRCRTTSPRVVGRYADNPAVVSWDVVNEVFDENGGAAVQLLAQHARAEPTSPTRSATPAPPTRTRGCASTTTTSRASTPRAPRCTTWCASLRPQGVPVDCVGFQGHLAIQYGFPGRLQQNLQRFADLGVQVRITELDVRMHAAAGRHQGRDPGRRTTATWSTPASR